MKDLENTTNKYYIISLSLDDAHIVKADSFDNITECPKETFVVEYRHLKFNYIDVEQEAQKILKAKRNSVDIRILFDENTTIDYLMSLPEMKDRQDERETQDICLSILKKSDEKFKLNHIQKYDEEKSMSDDDLYQRVKGELQSKQSYSPEKIPHFTEAGIVMGLVDDGYVICAVPYSTLDEALNTLHHTWNEIYDKYDLTTLKKGIQHIVSNSETKTLKKLLNNTQK